MIIIIQKHFFLSIALTFTLIIIKAFAFIPSGRAALSSVLIKNRIYFLGGWGTETQIIYLDVSSPFNAENPQWTDLTTIGPNPVFTSYATAAVGSGQNNNVIFL